MSSLEKWGLDPTRVPPAVLASEEPIIRFFAWHDMHPVAATMVLMEKFGHQWIYWEPETLKREILATFKATSVSDHNWNKLQAVRTIFTSISFWHEWPVFEKVIQALNNNLPDFTMMQRCTVAQLMAGIDMVFQLRREEYGNEIAKYVAACAVDQGVMYVPPPLEFAQTALSEPQYVCLDCGNVDEDDLVDGRCDFCVGRYMDHHNLNDKPAPWVPDDVGHHIERFVKRDPAGARKRFEELKDKKEYDINDESADDVQAAKLVVAYKYMNLRREQLVSQLEELKSWVSH